MTPGAVAADMRRRLRDRKHSMTLLHRIAEILRDGHALRFVVSRETARLWHRGDEDVSRRLEAQVDAVAERYHRTTMIVDHDGQVLYQRMLVA